MFVVGVFDAGGRDAVLFHGGDDGQVVHRAVAQQRHRAGQLEGADGGLGGVAFEVADELHRIDVRSVKTTFRRGGILRLRDDIDAVEVQECGYGDIA